MVVDNAADSSLRAIERGALFRVELRLALDGTNPPHPLLLDQLIAAVVTQARAGGELARSGADIEGGCASGNCTLAIEGLIATREAARTVLLTAFSGPAPRFGLHERMRLQRAWREQARTDDTIFRSAMVHAFSPTGSAEYRWLESAANRPKFSREAVESLWATLGAEIGSLVGEHTPQGAGSKDDLAHREIARPLPVPAPPVGVLTVGDPTDRAWVGIAWASSGQGDDMLRDAMLVGDFESLAVQGLREGAEPLTYDVESTSGTGWCAAVFQTDATNAARAADWLAAAVQTTSAQPAGVLLPAYLRLSGRYAGVRDSLAGQLAELRPLPPFPSGPLADGRVLGAILYGVAPSPGQRHWSACEAVGGQACR